MIKDFEELRWGYDMNAIINVVFWQNVGNWALKNWKELIVFSAWALFFLPFLTSYLYGYETGLFFIACTVSRLLFPQWYQGRDLQREYEMVRISKERYESELTKYPFGSPHSYNGYGSHTAPTEYYYPSIPTHPPLGFSSPFIQSWQDISPVSNIQNEWNAHFFESSCSFNRNEH